MVWRSQHTGAVPGVLCCGHQWSHCVVWQAATHGMLCVLCTTLASNVPESLTIWLHRPVLQLAGGDVLDIKCRVRALHGVSPDTRCRVYVGVCATVCDSVARVCGSAGGELVLQWTRRCEGHHGLRSLH